MLHLVGSEYIFIKGIASNSIESVLIIADQDNTTINVNGAFYDNLVNSGDYLIIKGDQFNGDGNLYVNTENNDDKIFAYQGTGKDYTATAGKLLIKAMYFVPPLKLCNQRRC